MYMAKKSAYGMKVKCLCGKMSFVIVVFVLSL